MSVFITKYLRKKVGKTISECANQNINSFLSFLQGEELERVKRELERRVAELEAANGELESKLANLYVYKESYSDGEATSAGEESLLGSPVQIAPLNVVSFFKFLKLNFVC